MILTTELFWDCECEKYYIHSKAIARCSKCESIREDQPDSHVLEVLAEGK